MSNRRDQVLSAVREKQARLAQFREMVRPKSFDDLDYAQRIDITYTSNALEGNTLTAGETALVLEKGLTIAGKPLKDHLEATDHARAFDWIVDISHENGPIREADIRTLHRLVVAQSNPDIAGQYADRARFVNSAAGLHAFPAPLDVPNLMQDFAVWLQASPGSPEIAFEAHRRLVAIHPFNDGNGRTGRLLMNLILLRNGYPAIAIRPEDRPAYIAALEQIETTAGQIAFDTIMLQRLDQTMDLYLSAAAQAAPTIRN